MYPCCRYMFRAPRRANCCNALSKPGTTWNFNTETVRRRANIFSFANDFLEVILLQPQRPQRWSALGNCEPSHRVRHERMESRTNITFCSSCKSSLEYPAHPFWCFEGDTLGHSSQAYSFGGAGETAGRHGCKRRCWQHVQSRRFFPRRCDGVRYVMFAWLPIQALFHRGLVVRPNKCEGILSKPTPPETPTSWVFHNLKVESP